MKIAPQNVDYLILEGTMIGRSSVREKTEDDLQSEFENYFKEDKLNLVYTSGQNIDRLVSIYKACNSTNKTLVSDPYIASILKESSRFANIQHPSENFKNIKVFFPYFLTGRMLKTKSKNLIYRFKNYKVKLSEVDKNPGQYVICVRPTLQFELEKMKSIDGGNLIYSLWGGYMKKEPTKEFINYLKNRGCSVHHIHTSGHADIPTLKEFVKAIAPKKIIPIHTFSGDQYKNIFKTPILELADRQTLKL